MEMKCKIRQDFQRPPKELVERFSGMQVANIDDNMGRIAAVDQSICPVGKGQLLGTAFTIRVPQGDNLMLHVAMDMAKPGDVIVIDAGGFADRAIFGELMATYMKSRGIKGVVCDGAIRDRDELAVLEGFPVFAKATTPNGPYKNGPGEINVPICVGGKVVHPGDIVVGDGDGVLFIRPEQAAMIADATEEVSKKEEKILKDILEEGTYIRPWVEEKMKQIGFEMLV